MATTTAMIFVGQAHQNHSGINPTHLIRLTENSRPALIMQSLDGMEEPKVVIPTLSGMVHDIYLMAAVYILGRVRPSKEIHSRRRDSLYDILDEAERQALYAETMDVFKAARVKLVFNILEESYLLGQLDIIKEYPNDFEVTLPAIKKEYSVWSGGVITKGI